MSTPSVEIIFSILLKSNNFQNLFKEIIKEKPEYKDLKKKWLALTDKYTPTKVLPIEKVAQLFNMCASYTISKVFNYYIPSSNIKNFIKHNYMTNKEWCEQEKLDEENNMNKERDNYLEHIYLILVNDQTYYAAFIDLFKLTYKNKPKFHHLFSKWNILTSSTLERHEENISNLSYKEQEQMFTQHLSRYSEEVLDKYVSSESVKKLIQDKFIWKSKNNRRSIKRLGETNNKVTQNKIYNLDSNNFIIDDRGEKLYPALNDKNFWEIIENINNSPPILECNIMSHEDNEQFFKAMRSNSDYAKKRSELNNNRFGFKPINHIGTITGRFSASKPNFKQKEKTMNSKEIIKTTIYVFGEMAKDMSDDELFFAVNQVNEEITKFEKMTPKPNKLSKRIEELTKQRDNLIAYIDDRED